MFNVPLISVITIVYNGFSYIEKTIQSVVSQSNKNIEYLVIDGGSTDGTVDVIHRYDKRISQIIVEKDQGIYDAMNKGLDRANGDYVIFMNGGDCFASSQILSEIFSCNSDFDFLYGDSYINDKNKIYYKRARPHQYAWYGMFAHHQSMIYNLRMIRRYGIKYDLSYIVAADYKFTLEVLKYAHKVIYLSTPISIFLLGGISEKKAKIGLLETEKARKEIRSYSWIKLILIRFILTCARFCADNFRNLYRLMRYSNNESNCT